MPRNLPTEQSKPDEEALAERLAAIVERRDQSAFIALFEHFAPRIKSFYLRSGTNAATAEELVQEVMLQIWRRAAQYNPSTAAVSTWVYAIARNKRVDHFRRERRPEIDPDDPALVPDPPMPADVASERDRSGTRVRAAIEDLPREQADVLRQFYFADQSHNAIANTLGVPLGTVKSRLRLALSRLRAQLRDDL